MQRMKSLSQRLWLAGVVLLTSACSDATTASEKCADDELDCDAESIDGADDDEADDSEDEGKKDAGKVDAGTRRDAGANNMPIDSGSQRRDSSSRDGGGPASGDSGTERKSDAGVVTANSGGGTTTPDQTLPPVTDYAENGPFKTTTQANTGPGNSYTIFRPEPLGENGFLHSPIIFGPGIITEACWYTAFLTHLASHGFVTISVNSLGGGPGDPGNLEAMKTGLDWLIAQNSESGVFQGKLAVDRAIAMGYSIGATASTQLSSHEAIMTTVSIHGHNAMGDPHGPVLLLTGTDDVIDANRTTLTTLEEAPAILMALPIGHLDVLAELSMDIFCGGQLSASARYIAPITAWLRYWVNGDQEAKRFFWGADCEMCSDPWIAPETNAKWDDQML